MSVRKKLIEGVTNTKPCVKEDWCSKIHVCPFCREYEDAPTIDTKVTMDDIQHDTDCVYVFAKNLKTK